MDPYYSSDYDVWVYLIAFVTLAIVPVMIVWWLAAQLENRRRRRVGIQTGGSRWHFLRYGPTAPLISAAVFLCGLPGWIFRPAGGTLNPTIGLCLMVMTASGLIALVISAVLSDFSNAPPRPKRTLNSTHTLGTKR